MKYNQFSNLSCYEEFEIQCALTGISKLDILKKFGNRIDNYYFFISHDGIFNWYDLEGNHIKDPGVLKEIKENHIPKNITKCVIPDSVTSICNYSFYDCESLISITIPNSVTSIGYGAFGYCESLKEIIIPDNLTSIGYNLFFCCKSLIGINIPDSVTSIGNGAFYRCESLSSITIPNSVIIIGHEVFSYCESLKEVIFKGKTLDKVKQMERYPFGIEDESIIKYEM